MLLQVDDSLGFGTSRFLDEEDHTSKKFKRKPRQSLTERPVEFNKITIRKMTGKTVVNLPTPPDASARESAAQKLPLDNHVVQKELRYRITKEDKIMKLEYAYDVYKFVSNRALAQYIGVNFRPESCAHIQIIAPGKDPPSKQDLKLLKKITKFMKETIEQGLEYVRLGLKTERIVLLTDASFADAKDLKRQRGYLVIMVHLNNNCNILHYASNR